MGLFKYVHSNAVEPPHSLFVVTVHLSEELTDIPIGISKLSLSLEQALIARVHSASRSIPAHHIYSAEVCIGHHGRFHQVLEVCVRLRKPKTKKANPVRSRKQACRTPPEWLLRWIASFVPCRNH